VLLYAAPTSPLSQPLNLVGGHALSSFIGGTTCRAFERLRVLCAVCCALTCAVCAVCAVSCHKLFAHVSMPLAAALAVSISIAVMQLTCTLHPPGGPFLPRQYSSGPGDSRRVCVCVCVCGTRAGASAIIAVLASGKVVEAGYYYVLTTVLGALVMLAVALVVNNLPRPPNLRHAPPLRPKN